MEPTEYVKMAEAENGHWWFVARRSIIADTIASLKLSDDADILEIGAGTGGNLTLLSAYGHTTAVEMNDYARDHATKSSGVFVQAGYLPSGLPAMVKRFDLICMFDVLEHIEDEAASLKRVTALLKPGGKLLITVPAYMWMWSNHDTSLHHFRRYTRKSLAQSLAAAGLRPDRLTYFNTLLLPLAAASRLVGKGLGHEVSPGAAYRAGWINTTLRYIFQSEKWLLRQSNLPAGLSLMALASRAPSQDR